MYNPRSNKQKKINTPFPFPSYVVKSYSAETQQTLKGIKINSQKLNKQIISQNILQRRTHKNEVSQKVIHKNNNSTKAIDQIYTLIYPNAYDQKIIPVEKQFKQKINNIHSVKIFELPYQKNITNYQKNMTNYQKNMTNHQKNMANADTSSCKEQIQLQSQIQFSLNSLNMIQRQGRKNLYRTRQHKQKSNSPLKKVSLLLSRSIIVSFRNNLISLYSLLNRKQDYISLLKNKALSQSLYPSLKSQQIQQLFMKYLQTKGRDKGRTKFNYLVSQQLRSLKYKTTKTQTQTQSNKKQKKQKKQDDPQQTDEDVADGQQKPELIDFNTWKRRNGVAINQKVFIVKGGYAELRKTLIDKGWYQNQDVWSPYFDFKWTTKIVDIDFMSLRPHQAVNHFNNNQHLTSKYGITRRLKTLYLSYQIDIDKFYPRCYDLADLVEFQNFVENFKFGFAQTVAKRFLVDKKRYENLQLKVRTAYQILKRRNVTFKTLVHDINKGGVHFIKPQQWQILTEIAQLNSQPMQQKLKTLRKKQTPQITYKIEQPIVDQNQPGEKPTSAQKHYEQLAYQCLHIRIQQDIKKLSSSDPQVQMNGYRNVWIAKPNFLSRGRGIRCYNNLYDIVTYCCGGTGQFVAQKYIQNPLLIAGKKFDIRQWVLIQDYNPPKIWFYDQCYIRFCADQYSLDNISNRFQHLTNNSIQKYNKNLVVDQSMWQKSQFVKFIGQDKWLQIVQKIKNIVVWTIKSCQGFCNARKGNNQLVGYDFMIDQNLNPWLIQINMSPSMEYSTPVTKKLVKMVLQDTAKVIASNKKTQQIGGFKCIYKGNQDLKNFSKYKIV